MRCLLLETREDKGMENKENGIELKANFSEYYNIQ